LSLDEVPKGTALLLATGIRTAVIRLRPWMGEPYAAKLAAAIKHEEHLLTERARSRVNSRARSMP
jgi:hypothetical protein